MKTTIWSLIIVFSNLMVAQNLKQLKPTTLGETIHFTKAEAEYWQTAVDSFTYANLHRKSNAYFSPKIRKAIDSLETEFTPLTIGPGCSWYCGGGPYKITASSVLNQSKKYEADNIHDFNILTPWVPETKSGIGATINFYFKAKSPRITDIIIYNGYIKTQKLWEQNARVKKLKLKINNKPVAILDLVDTTAPQFFKINPTSSNIEGQDLILTFEILEVYKGSVYEDVVISEINFDGIDVH